MSAPTFNIPWYHAEEFSVEYKTDIDSEFTEHEQRNSLWDDARRAWSIRIWKNPQNFAALQDFFHSTKGRFRQFNFLWDINKGGDGQMYLVRCLQDKLTFRGTDEYWILEIVQVMSNE